MDFVKFLLGVEGFIPALCSFVGLVLSFVLDEYLVGLGVPPELVQAFLALLTVVLGAFAGYSANPAYREFKAKRGK